jgi:hypothetical protein
VENRVVYPALLKVAGAEAVTRSVVPADVRTVII